MKCLVVGHVTRDLIHRGSTLEERLGGGAYYSALALSKFCRVEILTSFSSLPEDWVRELEKIGKLRVVPSEETTTYELNYFSGNERTLRLLGRADEIDNLPEEKYDVLTLNPVANEISPKVAREAREKGRLISADIQGFLRPKKPGPVVLAKRDLSFLKGFNVVHGDVREIEKAEGLELGAADVLLVTNGSNPGMAYFGVQAYRFHPILVDVPESTGAGDVFLASFSAFYSSSSFTQALKMALAFTALFLVRRSTDFTMAEVEALAERAKVEKV
jgi:sugar/nucleoside kinase (ribokinase family)